MANAGAIRAGSAFVELFADDSALQKGLASAEKSVKQFGLSVGKIGASIGGLGAAITAPMIAAAAAFAESGSALLHMSERTGMSVEALSNLGYAAKQSGTDLEGVETGIRRLQKAMTAGSLENQQAAQTFQNLGLNIQRLMKLKPDEQFNTVATRLAAIANPAARAGAAMMLFGRSGTALLPMIEHLGALTEEFKTLGGPMTRQSAEAAERLRHSMVMLDVITKKIIGTIGSALAPSFEAWNKALAKVEKSVLDLVKANKPLVVTIATLGFALVAAGTAITALGVAIFGFGQVIGAISAVVGVFYSALLLLTTPLGLVALGFVGATIAMGKWGDLVETVTGTAKDNFSGMLDTAKETFAGISDAMQAGDIALAAQVLFAGLKVEFLQGTTSLAKIWNDWGVGLTESFRGISFNIASIWIDLQANLKSMQAKTAADMEGTWAQMLARMVKGGLLQPGLGGPLQLGIEALTGVNPTEEIMKGMGIDQAAPSPEAADIEQKRREAQAALLGQEDAEAANRRKAAAAAVEAAENDLALAQIELHKVGMRAEKAKERAAAKSLVDAAFGRDEDAKDAEETTPEDLAAGVAAAAAKTDVSGTFSAAAAAGMGVGSSIEKEHLNESKKQTGELEKIRKNTAKQQVFAP